MEPSAVAPQAHRYGWCPQGTLPGVDLNSAGHVWRLLPGGKYTNPLLYVYLLMAGVIITASVYLFRAALCFLQALLPAWSQGKIFLAWMVMAQAPRERGTDLKWCRNKRNNPPWVYYLHSLFCGCMTAFSRSVSQLLCIDIRTATEYDSEFTYAQDVVSLPLWLTVYRNAQRVSSKSLLSCRRGRVGKNKGLVCLVNGQHLQRACAVVLPSLKPPQSSGV